MSHLQAFMPPYPLNTAVLFLVFNRLETTRQVFEAIRQAKPPRLYIAADGPRENRADEIKKVKAVRDYVMAYIDWDCEVKTLFRDTNLGCKHAVSEAITWFFEQEEQGIILEDDCLPSQSFFWYCEDLLQKYKNEDSVYLISGYGRGSEPFIKNADYGFCKYALIWGWASWAKVWEKYDPEMSDWPKLSKNIIHNVSKRSVAKRYWTEAFSLTYKHEIDTWDYQLHYLLVKNGGKSVVPRLNLISNIGFGTDATHTFDINSENANRRTYDFSFPIKSEPDRDSKFSIDDFYDRYEFSKKTFIVRAINKISRLVFGKNFFR